MGWEEDLGLDFEERIALEGFVDPEPPIGADTIFVDDFEARARQIGRKAAQTQKTNPKNGPWSANNQLGNRVAFAPDDNNEQTVLRLDEWGMPRVWTISLGIDFDFSAYPDTSYFDVTAVIDYGSGGTTQQVEIDWKNGASISLPFNALNLRARYNLSALASGAYGSPAPPADLNLTAIVSHGNLTKVRPTRTVFAQVGDQVEVPKFSSELIWQPVDPTLAQLRTIYDISTAQRSLQFDGGGPGATVSNVGRFETPQLVEYLTLDSADLIVGIGRPVPIPVPVYARKVFLINISPTIVYKYEWQISV